MKFTKTKIKQMQAALKDKGFYRGKIDGLWGPLTDKAIIEFKSSVGLRPRPFVGPITWGALMEKRPPLTTRPGEPVWLRNARSYIGLREFKGSSHNKKILHWWKLIKTSFKDDETPWCAAFVGGTLEEVGIKSTRSAMARSYDKWGKDLDRPAVGCVVTFWRGSRSSWKGHVAYVVGKDQRGRLLCLGGNQSDATNVKPFSLSRVMKYRWPLNVADQPDYRLPVYHSTAAASSNEA